MSNAATAVSAGDTAWVLTASALVLFMTLPGLALFYGGLVRAQNVLSVLMHCFVICCVVSVLWVAVRLQPGLRRRRRRGSAALGRAFLPVSAPVAAGDGSARERLRAVPDDLRDHHAGADHRRLSPSACVSVRARCSRRCGCCSSMCRSRIGCGAAAGSPARGTIDFAGGIVVHTTAGVSALVVALLIGPRARLSRRPDAAAQPRA